MVAAETDGPCTLQLTDPINDGGGLRAAVDVISEKH
jgi:hypothetical protein